MDKYFGIELEHTSANAIQMAPNTKKHNESEEKEWENPVNPALSTDERDKEQLLRQYKEAKRRKDNLTEDEDTTDKKDK
ncbi:hypothetical protein JN11_03648 [Mucilaginibacter frigoritolerans]|uniref:Uncharacterized protein n=1 Tax=Mucilaginibacter frigoritolerans TaxID=652788 RepID=A0A562TUF9_9SPHI|nr:hypothetical protein [Mucilaginibacter frigoritolerans]TWI97187.1 hypothetical protein JN11_03648 [Mucilaginibacter frigoritolerans]